MATHFACSATDCASHWLPRLRLGRKLRLIFGSSISSDHKVDRWIPLVSIAQRSVPRALPQSNRAKPRLVLELAISQMMARRRHNNCLPSVNEPRFDPCRASLPGGNAGRAHSCRPIANCTREAFLVPPTTASYNGAARLHETTTHVGIICKRASFK
jgi:hypothetical protein